MEGFDDVVAKKIDALLKVISEADKFESTVDILSVDELDAVIGGVAIPDYQKFLEYVRERSMKEQKNK